MLADCPPIPDHLPMANYLQLMHELYTVAKSGMMLRPDRTSVSTYSVFGRTLRFNLQKGFPLLTARKLPWKSVCVELCWFLLGRTDHEYLLERGCRFWDGWVGGNKDLGPIYGSQWRNFNGVDQIAVLIEQLKTNPYSRRHVVSAWNPAVLPDVSVSPNANADNGRMSLAPCHYSFQCYVSPPAKEGDRPRLSLQFTMRSSDVFLGLPNNIASYALLTHLLALWCDYEPYELLYAGTDVHLYSNHFEACAQLLTNAQRPDLAPLPCLELSRQLRDQSGFTVETADPFLLSACLRDYSPCPAIQAVIAI